MSASDGLLSDATITRITTDDQGTFGRFSFGAWSCLVGELPWHDNQSNISCIPKGVYKCVWTYSGRFKRHMYEITDVPQRTGIRIHSANFMGDESKGYKKQLNGCIALGLKGGMMDGQKALLLSKPAIRQFETILNGREWVLEIK